MPMFCWSLWKRGTKVALDERQVFVMLLIDEVYLLKRTLPKIKEVGLSTPVIGDGTEDRIDFIHNFMSTVLIARRVFEKIDICDPKRVMFKNIRKNFRHWDYEKIDESRQIYVKEFFGMIIHSSYISKNDKFIQIINDDDKFFRVSTKEFLDVLDSLCIGKNGAIWVMCKLFEKFVENIERGIKEKFTNELENLMNSNVNINEEVLNERLKQVHTVMSDEYITQDYFLRWLSFYCHDGGYCVEPDLELAKEILLHFFPKHKHRIEIGDFRTCGFMAEFKKMRCEISITSGSITESGYMEFLDKTIPVGKFLSMMTEYHGNRHHKAGEIS